MSRRKLAMYLATMGMEMCYLYVGLALVRQNLQLDYLSFSLMLALYPVSFFARLIASHSARISSRSFAFTTALGVALVSLAAALATWQILTTGYPVIAAVLPIGFSGLAWWLGGSLVRPEVSYPYTCVRFQIGIVALLVLVAFDGNTFIPIVLFFLLAALALALTRWESSVADSTGVLRAVPAGTLLLSSIAVLVPGLIIFLLLSPDLARVIVRWLITLMNIFKVNTPPPDTSSTPQMPWTFSCSLKPDENSSLPKPPPPAADEPMSPVVLWFIVFAAFLAVLFLIPFMLRKLRLRRETQSDYSADVEITGISINLWRQMVAFIKGIVARLFRFLLSMLHLRQDNRRREDELALSTRAIYRNLLHWAAKHDLPRAQWQTPWEYLKSLSQKFPQNDRELLLITDVYVAARYSRHPPSELLDTARRAWQKIKQP